MYSPIARSAVLRRNQTIADLLGNVFIHIAARSWLSLQKAEPCKEQISFCWSTWKATAQLACSSYRVLIEHSVKMPVSLTANLKLYWL